jgi:hypothetical protein
MGAGMVRAVVATVKRKNMMLVKQPNSMIVVVRCRACEQTMTHRLPSSIPDLTKFVRKAEHEHRNCLFRPAKPDPVL